MKFFLSSIFFLFLVTGVQAQHFKVGMLGGLVTSDVVGEDTLDHDEDFKKAGFVLGSYVALPVSEKFTIQMELTYIQKGYSVPPLPLDSNGNSSNNGYFHKLSLDYIEIPIFIKRKIPFTIKQKQIDKFELEAGLSAAVLIRHHEQDNTSSNLTGTTYVNNNYSAHIGISYFITPKFAFNIRAANSLNPIIPRNKIPPGVVYWYLLSRGTNTVWAFSLRYTFG